MYIEFFPEKRNDDVTAPLMNLGINGAMYLAGGTLIARASYCALTALGFGDTVVGTVTFIPTVVAISGGIACIGSIYYFVQMMGDIAKAWDRRI